MLIQNSTVKLSLKRLLPSLSPLRPGTVYWNPSQCVKAKKVMLRLEFDNRNLGILRMPSSMYKVSEYNLLHLF